MRVYKRSYDWGTRSWYYEDDDDLRWGLHPREPEKGDLSRGDLAKNTENSDAMLTVSVSIVVLGADTAHAWSRKRENSRGSVSTCELRLHICAPLLCMSGHARSFET